MSRRVTLDNGDLRSRLRAAPVAHRPSSYQARTRIAHTSAPSAPQTLFDFKPVKQFADSKAHPKKSAGVRSVADMIVYTRKEQAAPNQYQPQNEKPRPPRHAPQRTKVLARSYVQKPAAAPAIKQKKTITVTRSKILMAMAVCVFAVGMGVSVMGFYTNRQASAQAMTASKQVDAKAAQAGAEAANTNDDAPSTTPVSAEAVRSYAVAPDLARYITIPSIGVHARVLQTGVTADGSLGTPANVFDTAWYTGSAKPGQPGAALVDGHVSSWTTNGVFYDLKKLRTGDIIQIEKGDGTVLHFTVVKTVTYDASNVDMQSLMQSADAAKPGLNLITCGGKYDRNSGEFTQRVAVYTVLQ